MFKYIIIDLDGTLWNEATFLNEIHKNIDPVIINELDNIAQKIKKKKDYYTWIEVYEKVGLNYLDLMRNNSSLIIPYEGVGYSLQELSKIYSLWLGTDGGLEYTLFKVKSLGIGFYFKGYITSDILKVMKDNKLWWEKSLHMIGCSAKELLIIGDSINAN